MPTDRPAVLGGQSAFPGGPPVWPPECEAVRESLLAAFQSGDWGRYHGGSTERLKSQLSDLLGAEHVALHCSGTAAVEIGLRAMPVKPAEEVILSAYDFRGNFRDVLAIGAHPVLVDVGENRFTMDLDLVSEAIGPRTRAIIASHLHGDLIDMPRLRAIADDAGVPILEDACQVPGATIAGRQAGTWGDAGVFSFGGSKLLTAGRGGALFTDRDDIHQRARLDQQRGNEVAPLSELQAAVLVPQIEMLAEWNVRRRQSVALLKRQLSEVDGLLLPDELPGTASAYYKLGFIIARDQLAKCDAAAFSHAVRAEGVALDPGFRSLHRIHSRRRYRAVGDLPRASLLDSNALVLHHPVLLESDQTIHGVADAIRKVAGCAAEISGAS